MKRNLERFGTPLVAAAAIAMAVPSCGAQTTREAVIRDMNKWSRDMKIITPCEQGRMTLLNMAVEFSADAVSIPLTSPPTTDELTRDPDAGRKWSKDGWLAPTTEFCNKYDVNDPAPQGVSGQGPQTRLSQVIDGVRTACSTAHKEGLFGKDDLDNLQTVIGETSVSLEGNYHLAARFCTKQ